MATGAGAGYNVPDIDNQLSTLAQRALSLKYDAAKFRAWFDRISTGTDSVAAQALVDKVTADGGTLTLAKATLIIQAMREVTYWCATFAPTYTEDVAGPQVA